jgi:hypothetical protein
MIANSTTTGSSRWGLNVLLLSAVALSLLVPMSGCGQRCRFEVGGPLALVGAGLDDLMGGRPRSRRPTPIASGSASTPQEAEVSVSVLYMSRSLDGYIAGPSDEPGSPGGDGFARLHEWFVKPDGEFFRPSGPAAELFDEIEATGALLAGRRAVEQVDHWNGDHHGVPIFVPATGHPVRRSSTIRW